MGTLFSLETVTAFIKIFIWLTMVEKIKILLTITSCYKTPVLQIIKWFHGYSTAIRQLQDL